MLLLYNLFLILYRTAIAVAAIRSEKARAWQDGRRDQWMKLESMMPPVVDGQPRFWMHCASLGEFEQGRPVLEALRRHYPDAVLLLSFFSPSGYSQRRNYSGVDAVFYMPLDGPVTSRRFLDLVRPTCALFVKYEFWHYYLKGLQDRGVLSVLVSGAFRESQAAFRPWGGFFRKMISRFSILTVQDEGSLALLRQHLPDAQASLTGDTRFDRVAGIAAEGRELPPIDAFRVGARLLIAGSTWPEDERMLHQALPALPEDWKLILAPHEIDGAHLDSIRQRFDRDCVFLSEYQPGTPARVLIIDNIGMLSALYGYGEIAFVGGGFSRGGIHNVLEPAAFGLPVIMGPAYEKFVEAVDLVKHGFAFPVTDADGVSHRIGSLSADPAGLASLQRLIREYVRQQTGATAKIIALINSAGTKP